MSFSRSLVRRMAQERWRIAPIDFETDADGRGRAIYRLETNERDLHFVIFSEPQAPETHREGPSARSWDAVGFLAEGTLNEERIAAIRPELPNVDLDTPSKFLMGRAGAGVLGFSRAMRSTRAFDHVVDSLAAGRQPESEILGETGYMIRNRGFFGNGRHGTSQFETWPSDHPLAVSHHLPLLSLFLWREFGYELAERIAHARNHRAASLDLQTRRYLGVGNQSGIGLVRFVISHPRLIHTLCQLRELAIEEIRHMSVRPADPRVRELVSLMDRCARFLRADTSSLHQEFTPASRIAEEVQAARDLTIRLSSSRERSAGDPSQQLWAALTDWADRSADMETQEMLRSLLIEIHPEVVDTLVPRMRVSEAVDTRPEMSVADLHDLVRERYRWALALDLSSSDSDHYFYYLSELNREPRFGVKGVEAGAHHPEFLRVPLAVQGLDGVLSRTDRRMSVGQLLAVEPHLRQIVERVQSLAELQYAEVHGDITARDFRPMFLIRCMKSWFGTEKCESVGVRWIRGTLFQGAATAHDVGRGSESLETCPYPAAPGR